MKVHMLKYGFNKIFEPKPLTMQDVQEEQIRKQKAAKEAVRIQSLFCKSSSKGHKKEMNRQERERQERKRKEWMEQQK